MKPSPGVALRPLRVMVTAWTVMTGTGAIGAELVNNDSLQIRWDNSVKYTIGARTTKPSPYFTDFAANPGSINTNDGDGAFQRGDLITNRFDILSEFDVVAKDAYNSGLRLSAAAWYDQVYRGSHDAVPFTNATSVPSNEFTSYARVYAGRNIELYDAFVHSGADIGGHRLAFRLGRHTLTWGESLLLANGISAAQAPVDVTKVLTVPGLQVKDFFMPVNQLSGSLELSSNWSLQSYYQLEYRATRVPAPGTYFSTADIVFDGAENAFFGPGLTPRSGTQKPKGAKGQYGVALLYRNPNVGWDFGAYYLRYTARTPQIYLQLDPTFTPSNYFFVYPQKIDIFALSTSGHVGDASMAGEVSVHNNMPLVSNGVGVVFPGAVADGAGNPLYPVGRTLHFQASTIWTLPTLPLWDSSSLLAEFGGNTLMSVTKNRATYDSNNDGATHARTTLGLAVQFEPVWYQALPNVDLSLPIALNYNFNRKPSAVDPGFNQSGAIKGGLSTIGLKFTYANSIRGSLNYTKSLGKVENNIYRDRDFVSLNVNYSF